MYKQIDDDENEDEYEEYEDYDADDDDRMCNSSSPPPLCVRQKNSQTWSTGFFQASASISDYMTSIFPENFCLF